MTYCVSGVLRDSRIVCDVVDSDELLTIGSMTLCLSREQLIVIRDTINAHIEAHPEPAPFTPAEVEKIAARIEAEDLAEKRKLVAVIEQTGAEVHEVHEAVAGEEEDWF